MIYDIFKKKTAILTGVFIVFLICFLLIISLFRWNYVNIYAFSRRFYPKRLTVHSGYTYFYQYVYSLGIEPMTFCAANAMLFHWTTQEL